MTASQQALAASAPELRAAVKTCGTALLAVGIVSCIVNLLMLNGPLFMLQVYDRVIPSSSIPTLIGLFSIAFALFAFQGLLDAMRARILSRIGRMMDERLTPRVFDTVILTTLRGRAHPDALQASRDLDMMRSFLSGVGVTTFFDLPWIPVYVGICFLFHPLMGTAVFVGAILLCFFTVLTELLTRAPTRELVGLAASRRTLAETTRRNAELIWALGMRKQMVARWAAENAAFLDKQQSATDVAGGFGSASRTFRMLLQSAVLALGAYLVIHQESTPGVMLAATILAIRALAPVELAIANWKAFVAARQSWMRLSDTLVHSPAQEERVPLPKPARDLRVTAVSLIAPGTTSIILHDVGFSLAAGQALGIIGPSGSGKSSLARALVGAWNPARGVIRLDGSTLNQWDSDVLGKCIGFLPQDVELLHGTVAQNITRFERDSDPKALMAAATAADVLDLIRRLPDGFETQVGEGGALLSGGQRQRIALARALYADPFLVVLDEPNSNLDTQGEFALINAIRHVCSRAGIAIIITHRPNVLAAVDTVLIMNEGRVQACGPRADILRQIIRTSEQTSSKDAKQEQVPNRDAKQSVPASPTNLLQHPHSVAERERAAPSLRWGPALQGNAPTSPQRPGSRSRKTAAGER